jgi:hypothetical protein
LQAAKRCDLTNPWFMAKASPMRVLHGKTPYRCCMSWQKPCVFAEVIKARLYFFSVAKNNIICYSGAFCLRV